MFSSFSSKNEVLPFSYATKTSTTSNQPQKKLTVPLNTPFATYVYTLILFLVSGFFFFLSLFKLPFFLISPQNFVFLFTLGCIFFHLSLATLHGITPYILFSFDSHRRFISSLFLISTAGSLLFSHRHLYLPCLFSVVTQSVMFLVSVIAYFSASAGLGFLTTVFSGIKSRISPF